MVAVRIMAGREPIIEADVVELGAEIGEIVVVGDAVVEAADFCVLRRLVERDLSLSRLEREGGVPGPAFRTVEPRAQRMWVGENGIDDPAVRNVKDELMRSDAGQQAVFRQQPLVGGVIQIEEVRQMSVASGDARQHALAARPILRGDEAVRVVDAHKGGRREIAVRGGGGHRPPRRASRSRRAVCMAGMPPNHVGQRRGPAEQAVGVGEANPLGSASSSP